MTTKKYKLQLTPEQTLAHLTAIASGLLAGGHFTVDDEIGVTATGVLRELIANVEYDINEGDASRYIDAGDPRRHFLPGSDNERRAEWLKNPVVKQP